MPFSTHTGATRRSLLASLAAELRKLGAPALIALAESDHPVLYTVRGGRRVAVVAVQVGERWCLLWGGHEHAPAERPDLAARFLCGARATVTALLDRRPRARGPRAEPGAGARLSAVA
ncbi:hypothetical protein LP52_15870 [Streptomonospora alba]|uniref:Uncharacterized protein n=1 Tax=Streptomonospora alba TaxID=183763 RepID=A0A0C2JM84_9ACTN|nr:hypothetical protein [Streptomonospora alba]KIH97997.1 hypothetical protein LP52_15870 [Streptomonospora alba]